MKSEARRRCVYFLAHVVMPVALGACVYLGWRSTDILVFDWIDTLGARGLVLRSEVPLPGWVLYSLPDGCWVYAYTSWMLLIWGRVVPWVFSGVVLAVGAELGQWLGLVPGTYDDLDVAFYVGAFFLSGACYAATSLVHGGTPGDGGVRVRERRQ